MKSYLGEERNFYVLSASFRSSANVWVKNESRRYEPKNVSVITEVTLGYKENER